MSVGTWACGEAGLRGPHQRVLRGDDADVPPLSGGVHAQDARPQAAGGGREEDRHHGGQPQRRHCQIRHQKVSWQDWIRDFYAWASSLVLSQCTDKEIFENSRCSELEFWVWFYQLSDVRIKPWVAGWEARKGTLCRAFTHPAPMQELAWPLHEALGSHGRH